MQKSNLLPPLQATHPDLRTLQIICSHRRQPAAHLSRNDSAAYDSVSMLGALLGIEAEQSSRRIERHGDQELLRLGLILNFTSDVEDPHASRRWVLPGTIGNGVRCVFSPAWSN